MRSPSDFEYMSNLQYKVKALANKVAAFESGEAYTKMKSDFKKEISQKDNTIKKLKKQLYNSECDNTKNRNEWMAVNEELFNECNQRIEEKDRDIETFKTLTNSLYKKITELENELRKVTTEKDGLAGKLEEEQGVTQKLTAQVNRDFENSSIPSSLKRTPKKVHNGRVKTENKQGAQSGHVGHGRKKQTPTTIIHIPALGKHLDTELYKPTGKIIKKQVVNVEIRLIVEEYQAEEFRNTKTGQRVHAPFPEGVVNEVNYGGSIKAFAFILNNHCNVSIAKTREFFSEITGGKLTISTGLINTLSQRFSSYTEEKQKEAFLDLLSSPVMHIDFTTANVNGVQAQIAICVDSEGRNVGYYGRTNKGHKGIEGTPVEDYLHTLVHDHDTTFYRYGRRHQECMIHCLRYLRSSMENEAQMYWNTRMYHLVQEMIHYRKTLSGDDAIDKEQRDRLVERYDNYIELARLEYEESPPTKYYRDGYNLYKRLNDFRDEHLLFLYDFKVPYDNNRVERLARIYKRKQKAMTVFRSFKSLQYLCDSLGIMESIKSNGANLYESITEIFNNKNQLVANL